MNNNIRLGIADFSTKLGCFNNSCGVCHEDFKDEEVINITYCKHCFHGKHIREWIDYCRDNNLAPTCPICRVDLRINPLIYSDEFTRMISHFIVETIENVNVENIDQSIHKLEEFIGIMSDIDMEEKRDIEYQNLHIDNFEYNFANHNNVLRGIDLLITGYNNNLVLSQIGQYKHNMIVGFLNSIRRTIQEMYNP